MTGLLSLPRVELALTPTPLVPAPRLSAAAGVEIWLKRDDLTGIGLGGNKVRALEFLLGEALAQGCDCLVTGAGPQSNWAMLAALAARRVGLDTHLLFYGDAGPSVGNRMLAELAGAEVTFTGDPDRGSVDAAIETTAVKLHSAGRRPYVLPRGGATALGAVGYARGTLELSEQLLRTNIRPAQLWLATGSCATQAGLVAGARWLSLPYDVIGVAVSRPVDECRRIVHELACGAADLIGAHRTDPADVTVLDGHHGPGYGVRSADGDAAAALVARTESVFLDPVFAAKAMAALIATAAGDAVVPGPVVFLVSGGAPTLFSVPEVMS
jgi:D-cysteine desulfhydrase